MFFPNFYFQTAGEWQQSVEDSLTNQATLISQNLTTQQEHAHVSTVHVVPCGILFYQPS